VTVLNSPGTLDADYRGEVCVLLINHSQIPYGVVQGDRIAQLVIAEVLGKPNVTIEKVYELSDTARGQGGFGSTGV
jgi:dUTP pyrophosphatase